MKTYNQLTEIQRYQIEALNKVEKKQNEIAKVLGVSPSTISRELKRNRGIVQIYCQGILRQAWGDNLFIEMM